MMHEFSQEETMRFLKSLQENSTNSDDLSAIIPKLPKLPKLFKLESMVYYMGERDKSVAINYALHYATQQLELDNYEDGIYRAEIKLLDDSSMSITLTKELDIFTDYHITTAYPRPNADEVVFRMIFCRAESWVGIATLVDRIHYTTYYNLLKYKCIRACILAEDLSKLGIYEISIFYHDDPNPDKCEVKITTDMLSGDDFEVKTIEINGMYFDLCQAELHNSSVTFRSYVLSSLLQEFSNIPAKNYLRDNAGRRDDQELLDMVIQCID